MAEGLGAKFTPSGEVTVSGSATSGQWACEGEAYAQPASADWPGEDMAEHGPERTAGIGYGGRASPRDEPVRAHEDRAVAGELAVAQPAAARVIEVAVEVADPQRVEREVLFRGELPGGLAPALTVLAGDQQEAPRRDET